MSCVWFSQGVTPAVALEAAAWPSARQPLPMKRLHACWWGLKGDSCCAARWVKPAAYSHGLHGRALSIHLTGGTGVFEEFV